MVSTTVGVRELRQNLSKHLERVKHGETLTVTERGKEVAKLVPSVPDDDRWASLIEKFPGTTRPEGSLVELIRELPPIEPYSTERIDELLADLRRDKL